jgi:hypothetical protein
MNPPRESPTDHIRHRIGGFALVSYLCVFLSTALASPPGVGQAATDEELVWREFLQWLTAQAPQSDPRQLVGGYRTELIRKGVSGADADGQMAVVWKLVFREPRA